MPNRMEISVSGDIWNIDAGDVMDAYYSGGDSLFHSVVNGNYTTTRDQNAHIRLFNEQWGNGISGGDPSGQYHGCGQCYDFSMLFGGQHKGRTINNEEDFEGIKEEYVQHMNDKHYEMIMSNIEKKKDVMPREFKKKDGGYYDGILDTYSMNFTSPILLTSAQLEYSFYDECSYVTTMVGGVEIIPTQRNSTARVNPRNLDRNARFRANMSQRVDENYSQHVRDHRAQ